MRIDLSKEELEYIIYALPSSDLDYIEVNWDLFNKLMKELNNYEKKETENETMRTRRCY